MYALSKIDDFVFGIYNLIWGWLILYSLYRLFFKREGVLVWFAGAFLLFVAVTSTSRFLAIQDKARIFASIEQTNDESLPEGPITSLYVPDTSDDLARGHFCFPNYTACTGHLDEFLRSPDDVLETGRGPSLRRWQLLIYDDRCSTPPEGALVRPGPFSAEITALNVCLLIQPIETVTARYELSGDVDVRRIYDETLVLMTLKDRETGQIIDQTGEVSDRRTVLVLGFLSADGLMGDGPYSQIMQIGHTHDRPLTRLLNQFTWNSFDVRDFEKQLRRGAPAPKP